MAQDPPRQYAPYGALRTVTTSQTLVAADGLLRVPAGNAAITLTMYASPVNGQVVLCDNLSSNAVTWVPGSGQTLMQPNSNATSTSYQVSGGVRVTWVYSTVDKIWKAG
jgi:hypothetical protein